MSSPRVSSKARDSRLPSRRSPRHQELEPQLLLLDGSHPCGFIIADLLQVPRVAIYTFQVYEDDPPTTTHISSFAWRANSGKSLTLARRPRLATQPLLHILEQQHGVYATTAMWPAVQAEYDPYRPTLAGRLRSAVVNLAMGAVILAMDMDGLFRRAGLNSTLGGDSQTSESEWFTGPRF